MCPVKIVLQPGHLHTLSVNSTCSKLYEFPASLASFSELCMFEVITGAKGQDI